MAYTQKNSCIHHVTLIGPIASGKSCLKDAMIGVPFETDHQSTIGTESSDIWLPLVRCKGSRNYLKIRLDDTAGEEKFRDSLTTIFVRHADCVLICFDLSDKQSFDEAAVIWLPWSFKLAYSARYILVGLKSDLHMKVHPLKAKRFAENEGMSFFGTSSKTGTGIKELLKYVAKVLNEIPLSLSLSISMDNFLTSVSEEEHKDKRKCLPC